MTLENPPNAVMLFAAGFGTRMGDITANIPKPLIQVNGRALVDHTLDLVAGIDPVRIVANLHYKSELLEKHLSPKGVVFSHEQPNILETGGGLSAALPLLGSGPVFTMNTDAIWHGPNPLELLLASWNPDVMDGLLVCVPLNSTVGRFGAGDFDVDMAGRITRGTEFVYGGVQIVKTEQLSTFKEPAFSLNLLWDQMLAERRLFAVGYPGKWCDVGHPEGIKIAEDLLNGSNV